VPFAICPWHSLAMTAGGCDTSVPLWMRSHGPGDAMADPKGGAQASWGESAMQLSSMPSCYGVRGAIRLPVCLTGPQCGTVVTSQAVRTFCRQGDRIQGSEDAHVIHFLTADSLMSFTQAVVRQGPRLPGMLGRVPE
jgi:hypothetical protein